jgi:hypothetical protein
MVAQSNTKQTISNSKAFRDKRYLGKEDMQRPWCRTNQIAANKALQPIAQPLRGFAPAELGRYRSQEKDFGKARYIRILRKA